MADPIRRYGIHAPQLVGRVSRPTLGEDPERSIERMIGELDAAMSELQRFLRYLMHANDSGQKGAGIVGVVDGSVSHPEIIDREVAEAHPADAITTTPAGGLAATDVQGALDELDAEKADFETVMMVADLGV